MCLTSLIGIFHNVRICKSLGACSQQFALKENYGDHYTRRYKAAMSGREATAGRVSREKFTLDGRLVGDLGEVLAQFEYGQ